MLAYQFRGAPGSENYPAAGGVVNREQSIEPDLFNGEKKRHFSYGRIQ